MIAKIKKTLRMVRQFFELLLENEIGQQVDDQVVCVHWMVLFYLER